MTATARQDRTVSKVPDGNIDNRLSQLQRAILEFLATQGQPIFCGGDTYHLGHLPTTGQIVDALGRRRDKCGYASVSRSLARLCDLGAVDAYYASIWRAGKGRFYALNPAWRTRDERAVDTLDRFSETPVGRA